MQDFFCTGQRLSAQHPCLPDTVWRGCVIMIPRFAFVVPLYFLLNNNRFFCPNEEAAMGIIVVSLPCTTYLCGSLIAFVKAAQIYFLGA